MTAVVELDPRIERDPLAREVRRRILTATDQEPGSKRFRRMWGTVVLVRRLSPSSGELVRELTLRFDYGRLRIHAGRIGRPDVSLFGTDDEILALGGSGSTFGGALRAALVPGALPEVFGGRAHPRFVYRLARLFGAGA